MAKCKVAVTDFGAEEIDIEKNILEPLGCEVVGPLRPPATKDEQKLIALVKDADFVITQFAPVTAARLGGSLSGLHLPSGEIVRKDANHEARLTSTLKCNKSACQKCRSFGVL